MILILLTGSTHYSYSNSDTPDDADVEEKGEEILPGAYQMDVYLPQLENKRIAVVGNQTSLIGTTHLVDSLISRSIKVVKVFCPEHGFRGDGDAGAKIDDGIDDKTGLPVISLYGDNKKPKPELLPEWTSEVSDEMKEEGRHYLASMGIYIFNRQLLETLMADPETKDFGKEIIPQAVGKHKILSFQYEGYWTDIGNIYSFFEANIALTQDVPLFNLFDSSQKVYTRARMLPPAKVSGTIINKAILAEGCIIHAKEVTSSVVGIRARVGKDTVIKNTYIMGCDYYETIEQIHQKTQSGKPILGIGERCTIEDAIVDKNCSIGNDVTIKGGVHLEKVDHPLYTIKDHIIVIKKGAIIPNGFKI